MNNLVIGNVELDGNLILAPMAGVTDLPFRVLCKEEGASLVYTEMISAKGIFYNNKNTASKLIRVHTRGSGIFLQYYIRREYAI